MKLYVFACKNITNIWAGIGAKRWAVSIAEPAIMQARATRARNVRVGNCGIIYCSHPTYKSLTTPFLIGSAPNVGASEKEVWPEEWRMPFDIIPLGSPRRHWTAKDAIAKLPFNAATRRTNVASVLKPIGTVVFSPIEIGDDDWSMLLEKLT
ncbi:hypothetical protein [Bosea sp. (in: a-proteobacteria)]|uniref:hypothetical protein n=1 Tax=Bosea sp. (in: a-proteobacteria) TaxID=1871050 RepID=UPI003F721DCC